MKVPVDPAEEELSFGVFQPLGHLVISFPDAASADAASNALAAVGVEGADIVRRYSDQEMLTQIDRDLQRASPLAGHHWLVVHAPDDDQAIAIPACVRACGA